MAIVAVKYKPTRAMISFCGLSLLYLVLLLVLPPNQSTVRSYNLSNAEYYILNLLLAVPRIVVWGAAFYGYAKLDAYSFAIRKTKEGQAFSRLSHGLRWLAWGLPAVSILTQAAGGIAYANKDLLAPGLIAIHFANLLVPLVAFSFIAGGTRRLLIAINKQISLTAIRGLMASFTLLAVLYTYFTVHSVQTQHPDPYRMPLWLILLVVVIPYLYAWLMGLFASYEIALYRLHTKGILYQKALSRLAAGFGLAIISSVVLQYIISTANYLRRIHLDWNLLILYIALLGYAAGFVLIAIGAARLKKIEEV